MDSFLQVGNEFPPQAKELECLEFTSDNKTDPEVHRQSGDHCREEGAELEGCQFNSRPMFQPSPMVTSFG